MSPPAKTIRITSNLSVNHNVFWIIVICAVYGIADNVWSGTVFAAYLKGLYGTNASVGYVEASSGIAGLVTALPIGYLADKYTRSSICKVGSVTLVVTALGHSAVLWWVGDDPDSHSQSSTMAMFLVIMFFWGFCGGIVNGPTQALYADSTPAGDRSKYYVYLYGAYSLASMAGPLISIILFQTLGDEWSIGDLKIIILVGMALEVVAALFLCTVDDKHALKEKGGEEEEAEEKEETEENEKGDDKDLLSRRKRIPYFIFFSDLMIALGSGMTVKFFPLYFEEDCDLAPTQVQIIYLLVPVCIVGASQLSEMFSRKAGRVQTILLTKVMGLGFLFAIVFFNDYLITRPAILIPIYLCRTGLMNATFPLQESILMDFVKKNERARWKSLESIGAFGWCGSAALGGWLADKHGSLSFTFLITACMQGVGVCGYLFLLPLVPKNEKEQKKGGASGEGLEEPLLLGKEEGREDEEGEGGSLSGFV
jgi:MFS family permease